MKSSENCPALHDYFLYLPENNGMIDAVAFISRDWKGSKSMKTLHLDCIGGISGDMFLSAVTGILPDLKEWERILADLPVSGWAASFQTRGECSLQVRTLDLKITGEPDFRHPTDIRAAIEKASLPAFVEEKALAMLDALAEAEARVHGIPVESVHFHELGGFDTLFDLVGCAAAVHLLEVDEISCSPLPMGRGTLRIEHGLLPVQTPATLELLRGAPLREAPIDGETVTPTGAVIIKVLVDRFASFGNGTLEDIGLGAGTRRNETVPNVLRALLFSSEENEEEERLAVVESNVDDMNPEYYDHLFDRLLRVGALDVWLSHIQMKKNRPAVQVGVLCRPEQLSPVREALFSETTTLGVRHHYVFRRALERAEAVRETPFGKVRGKTVRFHGRERWIPEYDELKRIADETGRPILEVEKEVKLRRVE